MLDEESKVTPAEIRGWNWGAFMYNIFWGIGNKSYLPLLCLIPVFNLVWIFVCGFTGHCRCAVICFRVCSSDCFTFKYLLKKTY